jgi:hypothetical protein
MSVTFRVQVSRNLITPNLSRIQQDLKKLPVETHKFFVDTTPIDTGNARRQTRLVNNRKIQARYSYAQVLDKGRHMTSSGIRGSRQAPQGMSKPTKQFIKQRIKQILRKQ